MKEWKKIVTQSDIEELLQTYNGFHDSYITSLYFKGGVAVDGQAQTVHYGGAASQQLRVTFKSIWEPTTVELCFTGLRRLHLIGWQSNYDCDILDAHLSFQYHLLPGNHERVIVWADDSSFDISKLSNKIEEPDYTYIVANELKWRIKE